MLETTNETVVTESQRSAITRTFLVLTWCLGDERFLLKTDDAGKPSFQQAEPDTYMFSSLMNNVVGIQGSPVTADDLDKKTPGAILEKSADFLTPLCRFFNSKTEFTTDACDQLAQELTAVSAASAS